MQIQNISNQNFRGKIHILNETFTRPDRRTINKVWNELQTLIKDKEFDLYIKKTNSGETIVGTDKSSGYIVSDNNILRSANLAIKDKLKGSYIERKMQMIKEYIAYNEIK